MKNKGSSEGKSRSRQPALGAKTILQSINVGFILKCKKSASKTYFWQVLRRISFETNGILHWDVDVGFKFKPDGVRTLQQRRAEWIGFGRILHTVSQ